MIRGVAGPVIDTVGSGLTVTVRVTTEEVPQPLAVTLISTLPENPFIQVINPFEELIVPAAPLLSVQLKPVLFVAVVE